MSRSFQEPVPLYRRTGLLTVHLAILVALGIWGCGRPDSPLNRNRKALKDPGVPVSVRISAARALGEMGPSAKAAVPELIDALGDEDALARAEAVKALGNIGPEAIEAVAKLTRLQNRDLDDSVREQALVALEKIQAPEAAGSPLAFYTTWVVLVALIVGVVVWARGRLGSTAVPPLIDQLRNKDAAARRRAARLLGLIGPSAKAAVPVLLEALKDRDESVRHEADLALGKIGLKTRKEFSELIDSLKDKDDFVRLRAAVVLGNIGPPARAAVPALIEALKDRNDRVRLAVIEALGGIGREAKPAVSHLLQVRKSEAYAVREAALRAIRRIQPGGGFGSEQPS